MRWIEVQRDDVFVHLFEEREQSVEPSEAELRDLASQFHFSSRISLLLATASSLKRCLRLDESGEIFEFSKWQPFRENASNASSCTPRSHEYT